MTAEAEENHDTEMDGHDDGDKAAKKKRAKARRQSGTAVAFQKRTSVRNLPERTTSSHLIERKGRGAGGLEDLEPPDKEKVVNKNPDRRGSQGAIKAATSALRQARGVPANRGVARAASSQNAPRRPDRAVAPVRRKAPARSSSSHGQAKPVRRGDRTSETPILTGADLLNLRKAQQADNEDAGSVGSDVESTYTMDSVNLRKSQLVHGDEGDDDCVEEIVEDAASVGSFGTLDSVKLRHLQVDDEHHKHEDDDDIEGEEEDSVSTLNSEGMADLDALAGADEEEPEEAAFAIDDSK